MLKKTLLFKKADRQLLVKCHGIKMEYATLQLGHLSTGSALGGKPTKKKKKETKKDMKEQKQKKPSLQNFNIRVIVVLITVCKMIKYF